MVVDLRYFNSLEHEVDSLTCQLETQKTQFVNEIDRLSREYYYADHMNAILGVYTELDELTNLQCDYLELLEKCDCLEKELSKSQMMSKSFEALQKHAINLEIDLQQCQEKITNDKSFKENQSKEFCKERELYFEIQDLKAQLQDKGIVIRVIPTTSVSRPQLKSNPMEDRLVEIVLFIVDCGCSKHMMENLKLLINFVEKFLGTVKFGNDQIAPILRYRDLVQGAVRRKHKGNVSKNETQQKNQPEIKKPKNVGTHTSLATPKPRKPRFLLRLFQAHDGKFKASHQFRLEVYGNCPLRE
nr:integrase, catalytic region, zinc finger, CCHC-type, peptidase aspartic, catalytic [Tanacetum cinerariifolium]